MYITLLVILVDKYIVNFADKLAINDLGDIEDNGVNGISVIKILFFQAFIY